MKEPKEQMQQVTKVAGTDRFGFGANWQKYLRTVDEERIRAAEASLQEMLGLEDLKGRSFLDAGSGSGLFSLAAHRLGARVRSFDYDPDSVECTLQLRARYGAAGPEWLVERGDVLDAEYMSGLGSFDIVYSWGVLHHTGDMWSAIANTARLVEVGGLFFVALYNDMGSESEKWLRIKKRYCALPRALRPGYAALAVAPYEVREFGRELLRLRPTEYLRSWTRYRGRRGMSRWRDIVDWVGGLPYEYAGAAEVTEFLEQLGFEVAKLRPTSGLGCNEFVFVRTEAKG